MLGLDESGETRILTRDARKAIRRLDRDGKERFDLVFLDPPYESEVLTGTLDALFETKILSDEARVVVETPKRHPFPPRAGVSVLDEREYGETKLTWLALSVRNEG